MAERRRGGDMESLGERQRRGDVRLRRAVRLRLRRSGRRRHRVLLEHGVHSADARRRKDMDGCFVSASGSRWEAARLARTWLDWMVQQEHRLQPASQRAVRHSGNGCLPCVDKRRRTAHLALREGNGLAVERRHWNCIWRGREDIRYHRARRQKRGHTRQPRRRGVMGNGVGAGMRPPCPGRRFVWRRLCRCGRFAQGLCVDGRADVPDRKRGSELERASAGLRAAFGGARSDGCRAVVSEDGWRRVYDPRLAGIRRPRARRRKESRREHRMRRKGTRAGVPRKNRRPQGAVAVRSVRAGPGMDASPRRAAGVCVRCGSDRRRQDRLLHMRRALSRHGRWKWGVCERGRREDVETGRRRTAGETRGVHRVRPVRPGDGRDWNERRGILPRPLAKEGLAGCARRDCGVSGIRCED